MSINPSPLHRAFVCPLCGEPIDAMTPEETRLAPTPDDWEPNLSMHPAQVEAEFRIAQNMAANEALIWAHFESQHSLREAVLALGVARNALMDIGERLSRLEPGDMDIAVATRFHDLVQHGLGGK